MGTHTKYIKGGGIYVTLALTTILEFTINTHVERFFTIGSDRTCITACKIMLTNGHNPANRDDQNDCYMLKFKSPAVRRQFQAYPS